MKHKKIVESIKKAMEKIPGKHKVVYSKPVDKGTVDYFPAYINISTNNVKVVEDIIQAVIGKVKTEFILSGAGPDGDCYDIGFIQK